MAQPLCFTDSTYYVRNRYPQIVSALAEYPDLCVITPSSFQFKMVGTLCVDGQAIVVFPKNYGLVEEQDNTFEARNLTKALIRYKNEKHNEDDSTSLLYGNDNTGSDRIVAASILLEDYCQNGLIRRWRNTSSQTYSGRTDWVATVAKTIPSFSNGHPVYTAPIVRRKIEDNGDIVHITHKYVIKECFKEWGWLFDYDHYSDACAELPFPISTVIQKLNNALKNTYIVREINIIKRMIQYLSGSSGRESEHKCDILATPYYAFVWESICCYLFSNRYSELRALLPQPVWESDVVAGNISQRPDIFTVRDNELIILDAKYYDYNRNIPGWHDVVKQLFYRHSMVSIKDSRAFIRLLPAVREIRNAFLMPGNEGTCEYIGRVHVPRVADLGEIKVFAINQKRALSAYARRDDDTFRNALVEYVSNSFTA